MADGARLKSVVSLRGFSRRIGNRALLLLQLALVVGAALVLPACPRKAELRERGLPEDLPDYLGQLEAIKVPAAVASLGWIPSTLVELDASETAITVIPFGHMGMERLDVHGAKDLKRLPTLPASIRELDIRFTRVEGPWRFPQDLESLALGGEHVETLEGLSGLLLLELTLDKVPNLRSSAGLPASLQSLSISDATFSQLDGLPARLKELRLENTQIRTLKGLPESLQSMTLTGNAVMEAELPRSLLSLTVDAGQQRLSSLDDLAFLNHLDLRAGALRAFPAFLRDLQVPAVGPRTQIAPSLRRLEITNDGVTLLPDLPPSLEELRWPGGSDLRKLPPGLKRLDIPASSLEDLVGLPPGLTLESLDVSLTRVRIDKLPASLRSLRYRFCPFGSISGLPKELRSLDLKGSRAVRVLQELPAGLQRLDVSQTSIAELPKLPDTLTELDISSTQIKNLQDVKGLRRLRRLTVHAGQMRSLAGLPGSVSELRFVERQ